MTGLLAFLSAFIATSTCLNDGGWTTNEGDLISEEGPCNIERHDASELAQKEFLHSYAFTEPVIIYSIDNTHFAELTKKTRMMEDWASEKVFLNSANTYSYTRVPSTFGEYLDQKLRPQSLDTLGNETLYLFGDIDPTTWNPLLQEYNKPSWELPGHTAALSFGIAGAGTGVPFHFHGPGFAEVIHGAKRWFLYPFEERPEFNPDRTTLEWFVKDYPNLPREKKPLECLMKPGELIYFPDKWWHATLNTRTNGLFVEFAQSFEGGTWVAQLAPANSPLAKR